MTDNTGNTPPAPNNSRAYFEPLGFTPAEDDRLSGSDDHDLLNGDPPTDTADGLPGALAFWRFDDGAAEGFADSRGGPAAMAYRLESSTAVAQNPPPTRTGPDGLTNGALEFDGETSFGFIPHDPAMEVTQGTVAVWVQPDSLNSKQQIVLSKDQSGPGEGGHFRLGHDDEGRIFLRFAEGDGGSNKAWVSSASYLSEGQWTHLAVSFTEEGITVYADGVAIPDYGWYRQEGNLDSPALASEAYLLQNSEPWILGADTSGTKHNDTAAEFATDDEHLDDPFDGAIADFGLWGGFTPADALDAGEVYQLYSEGPGTALTAPAGAQPMRAGDDVIDGGAGNDSLHGEGGNDELLGGEGSDVLEGGYGDDILDGGAGNDVLEGGRGSDLLLGGAGDDVLTSRSDAGEQRIGQLAIGQPTREDPDNEVNPDRQKLYGWEDQPLVADDVLVGGAGRDTFLFNPQINAKRDIILEHVNDDRTIDWAGVAGENNELHDHWVDSFGIDMIADYRADEDTIAIVGHTVAPTVSHKLIDTDGDGVGDELASVISVYSNQGGGGGAHTEDLIGQIVVRGDVVDADDLVVEAGVTHGIVETVDELQEALAPSGELKQSQLSDGSTVLGYDTRDAAGNLGEVVANPEQHSDNPFLTSGRFSFAGNVPDDLPKAVAVIDAASHPELGAMRFNGEGEYLNLAHAGRTAGLAQTTGTVAFVFVADSPGAGQQTLFSKDASGYVSGGHLTAWIDKNSDLVVRYQSTDKSVYLKAKDFEVQAGQDYHFAFSFDAEAAKLYVDGQLRDAEELSGSEAFVAGMSGNSESLVFGASTMHRPSGTLDKLREFFDGFIDEVVIADRPLHPMEVYRLAAAEGDFSVIGLDSSHPVNTPPDQQTPETGKPVADTSVVTAFAETEGTEAAETIAGSDDNDIVDGGGGDDILNGGAGHDGLTGGYGNDQLNGGGGNDRLDGGRGSDLLNGGAGDDLLIARSDSGEQRIGQLAIGEPTRPDPDNEVNPDRQKLYGWEDQPLVGDDVLIGGEGKDTFLLAPQINAKEDIINKHVRDDGSIRWSKVAGENNELHDHWVDSSGIDIIADYNANEDHIAIIGHTANVEVEHRDVDGDGDEESIITVYSNQGGGGGAHTEDLIGQAVVFGDRVEAEDIVTDAGVTYGIVDNVDQIQEALNPQGELKTSDVPGEGEVIGYDTRDDQGNLGAVVSDPFRYSDNPFLDDVTFAAPSEPASNYASRAHFEQLDFAAASNDTLTGTDGDDVIAGDPAASVGAGLPGALAFWSFGDGSDGAFANARGGPEALAYKLHENQAVLQTAMPLRAGPDGRANGALEFDGETSFGFIAHDAAMEVTQGTVAVWVQPDSLNSKQQIVLSKDQCGPGEGGHFRLGHDDEGRVFLRFAEGDGGSNKAWVSSASYLSEGQWTHLAVSFTEEGITVYADGVAIPDYGWYRQEGNLDSPALASEAYLLQNSEPWILGADTSGTKHNDTAAEFATDDEHLDDPFDGAIADFGLWGGFTPADALDAGQVHQLYSEGPGTALTAPAGSQPMRAGDDVIDGGAGNDSLHGEGGNDELLGGEGSDVLEGGYGDDILDGGAGNDVLEGGRGSDLLLGGAGDDVLTSRSDAGEQRIGQLAIGQPTREDPDNEVNQDRQKLYGWEDQPLVADDVLVGGAGRDTFLFNPQINAKRDIILEHVNDDRTIDWAGVAGENNELHDHWVDSFGIDMIADYRADEDTIAIVGHTVAPTVSHKLIDTDGDGVGDELASVISVYSNQGGGGGAHTEDLIGQIVVRGDVVDADDLVVEAGVTHGIVETVDELQEALAPSGELKQSQLSDGSTVLGYDTRDAAGNLGEVVANPEQHSDNPFLTSGRFSFAGNVPDDLPKAVAVIDAASHPELGAMRFNGEGEYLNLAHAGRTAGLAQTTGTVAFVFVADSPGAGQQTLFSKDASGYVSGGHLTAWIDKNSDLVVRYQSTDKSVYLKAKDFEVQAGQDYHFAFSFDAEAAKLYVDGQLRDAEELSGSEAFVAGMSGNSESLVFGASTMHRPSGTADKLREFFDGSITDVVVLDRDLYGVEALKLAQGILDYEGTTADQDPPAVDPEPPAVDPEPPAVDPEPPVVDPEPPAVDPEPPVVDPEPPAVDPEPPAVDPDPPTVDDDQVLRGTAGQDVLTGGSGNDEIVGRAGNDRLHGGDGDDVIRGNRGADKLSGGKGDDDLRGGNGNDQVDGGRGDDWLSAGKGNDTVTGGAGADTIRGGRGNDDLAGESGDDIIAGGTGADEIDGGADADIIRGNSGADRLFGGTGDDVIRGDRGDDLVVGQDGNDVLFGGSGNDVLIGNSGDDILIGGRGQDDFVYDTSSADNFGVDVIRDFRTGQDKLMVSNDVTLWVEDLGKGTRVILKNAADERLGEIELRGNGFDADTDVAEFNPGGSLDLFG